MLLRSVVSTVDIQVYERMLAFTRAKHDVHVENVANALTPGYRAKRLDPAEFQRSLRSAIESRGASPVAPLVLPRTDQVRSRADGALAFTPDTAPAENILFHDGTNVRIEHEMSEMAENAMTHQLVTELLKGEYDGLNKAIFGRVT
jgi:flagellar basal-body rod protein FlgB